MLEKLIEGISSWSDLEARMANLPTEIDRGNAFEEFCHGFFILDPVFPSVSEFMSQNRV